MPPPSPRRGLQTMRTQSSRKATNNLSSPELYIRLTSLEMERARRVIERDRLMDRIRTLDERIAKIAEEQSDLRIRVDRSTLTGPQTSADEDGLAGGRDSQCGFTY